METETIVHIAAIVVAVPMALLWTWAVLFGPR